MHRDEQIRPRRIGRYRSLVERNVVVILARIDHFGAQPRLKQLAQALGDFQHQIFLQQSVAPHRA